MSKYGEKEERACKMKIDKTIVTNHTVTLGYYMYISIQRSQSHGVHFHQSKSGRNAALRT